VNALVLFSPAQEPESTTRETFVDTSDEYVQRREMNGQAYIQTYPSEVTS
jgi:hypothetical protein